MSAVLLAVATALCALGLATADERKPPDGRKTSLAKAENAAQEITFDLGKGVMLELVRIPAGRFYMGMPPIKDEYKSGAPPPKDAFERPRHTVTISAPFYLSKYPVTQEQWQAVMDSNPSCFVGAKNPVDTVSWDECQVFLARLKSLVPAKGRSFALPTEAQWEYACRAGGRTLYCCGNDASRLGEYAWYDVNSDKTTHPVGQKKPNAWGLYDMHGNVWQWCQDVAAGYSPEANTDPRGPEPTAESDRIFRGGSITDTADRCRSACRGHATPWARFPNVGLRVAVVSPEAAKGPTLRLAKDTRPDIRFVFDFSAVQLPSGDAKTDAALKSRCDRFVTTTCDQIYPILREITGVYVGKYYKEISYTIVPPATVGATVGGCALDNHIKLDRRYSIDLATPGDEHELIHVMNHACGAMHGSVDHVWHGALMDAVDVRLGRKRPSNGDPAARKRILEQIDHLLDDIEKNPRGFYSPNRRSGILAEHVMLFYYDHGEEALGRLYRSTINPHPAHKPSPKMVQLWREAGANQLQALVETLKRDYKFEFDQRSRAALGL